MPRYSYPVNKEELHKVMDIALTNGVTSAQLRKMLQATGNQISHWHTGNCSVSQVKFDKISLIAELAQSIAVVSNVAHANSFFDQPFPALLGRTPLETISFSSGLPSEDLRGLAQEFANRPPAPIHELTPQQRVDLAASYIAEIDRLGLPVPMLCRFLGIGEVTLELLWSSDAKTCTVDTIVRLRDIKETCSILKKRWPRHLEESISSHTQLNGLRGRSIEDLLMRWQGPVTGQWAICYAKHFVKQNVRF